MSESLPIVSSQSADAPPVSDAVAGVGLVVDEREARVVQAIRRASLDLINPGGLLLQVSEHVPTPTEKDGLTPEEPPFDDVEESAVLETPEPTIKSIAALRSLEVIREVEASLSDSAEDNGFDKIDGDSGDEFSVIDNEDVSTHCNDSTNSSVDALALTEPVESAVIDQEDVPESDLSDVELEPTTTALGVSPEKITDMQRKLNRPTVLQPPLKPPRLSPVVGTPTPDAFHEIAIDVPNEVPEKHIRFNDGKPRTSAHSSVASTRSRSHDVYQTKRYGKSRLEKLVNILLCRRDLAGEKFDEKPVPFCDLFKYGTPGDKVFVIFGLIFAALCGLLHPLVAIYTGRLVDTFLLTESATSSYYDDCRLIILLFALTGVLILVLAFLQFCFLNFAAVKITNRIRAAYLKSILRQNATWFERHHSGSLTTKLNDHIERITEGIGDKMGLLVRHVFQYVFGLVVALYTCWEMTLPLLLMSPIVMVLMATFGSRMTRAIKEELKVSSAAGAIAQDAIMSYRTVAAFNAQETEVDRYRTELRKGLKHGIRRNVYAGIIYGGMFMLSILFMGISILYGAVLHAAAIVDSPGEIFTVLYALMSASYYLGHISPHLMVVLTARVAAATVYHTINRVPSIDPYSSKGRKLYDLQGRIEFRKVSFRYPKRTEQKALKSFSFVAKPGQTIAIVGHSGCGKSTVFNILNRLYDFDRGIVSIDGVDVKELDIKWLRTVMATVSQEPVVFADTVANNVRFGYSTLTEKEITEACKLANAHEFISALPGGYEARIGEGGVQLSGGQKQRLAIARALARNPRILLLDEATSALDNVSETAVQQALANAKQDRTTIVIAHRLSTIREADRIIVMAKGRLIEAGTHDDLVRRQGVYARLVYAQELDRTFIDKEIVFNEAPTDLDAVTPTGSDDHDFPIERSIRRNIREEFQREFAASSLPADIEALTIEVEKTDAKKSTIATIFMDYQHLWPALTLALIACFFNALCLPLSALVYGKAFEIFENHRKNNIPEAAICFGFFCVLGVVMLATSFLSNYFFGKIGETITLSMRVRALRSILYQDGAFFDDLTHSPSKLVTRLAVDAPCVRAAMDMRLGRVAYAVIALLSAFVISIFIAWPFALATGVAFAALGAIQICVAGLAHAHAVKAARHDAAGLMAIEAIENVIDIQLLTAEQAFLDRYVAASVDREKVDLRQVPFNALNYAISHGMQYIVLALCYGLGVVFVGWEWIHKIAVFQVVQTVYYGSVALVQCSEFFPEFIKSRLAATLMYSLIDLKPRTGSLQAGKPIIVEGDIRLENVYFAYPARPRKAVVKGLTLQVRPGQSIGLVGPSGSGKSTIISLIERIYDPSMGYVKVDGFELPLLCLRNVRSQIAVVEQMPRLLSNTVRENIIYGMDAKLIRMEDIEEAAQMANAAVFIQGLPQGYDTVIGENGQLLSVGQRQRIAIARAVIRKPKVLLLDEATSSLDSSSEKVVQEALERAKRGRTCITIAHRISTVQACDQIVFIENGVIKEKGTHRELIARGGKYATFVEKQRLVSGR